MDVGPETMGKVTRRIVPLLFVLYVVNFLDRVNVGFAALDMNRELGFSPEVYGFGAGVFFLGYILLEIPSNMALHRVGARLWLSRIMVTWGVAAVAAALTQGRLSFYALRFLLGAAEAGFVPGVVYYLTLWYPARERARAVAQIWTATAAAVVIGAPLSALILRLDGALGLPGWRWIFILEGLPAVVLGLASLRLLPDGPGDAAWLGAEERAALVGQLEREERARGPAGIGSVGAALASGAVWRLSALYFCIGFGFFGITLWLPQIVRQFSGLSTTEVSLMTTVPFALAAVAMVGNARHSDRTGERRWHLAAPLAIGAAGLVGGGLVHGPGAAFALICVAAMGMWSSVGVFWSVPAGFLGGRAAAGGLALINAVGGLAGFAGPYLIGVVRSASGDFSMALVAMGASISVAAALAATLPGAGGRGGPARLQSSKGAG